MLEYIRQSCIKYKLCFTIKQNVAAQQIERTHYFGAPFWHAKIYSRH